MAWSKCPKCQNTSFEVVINEPADSAYKLLFVQCKSCGTVVGVMDYYNIGSLMNNMKRKLDELDSSIRNLAYTIESLRRNLGN